MSQSRTTDSNNIQLFKLGEFKNVFQAQIVQPSLIPTSAGKECWKSFIEIEI